MDKMKKDFPNVDELCVNWNNAYSYLDNFYIAALSQIKLFFFSVCVCVCVCVCVICYKQQTGWYPTC